MTSIREILNQDASQAAGDAQPMIRYVKPTAEVIAGRALGSSPNVASAGVPPLFSREKLRTGRVLTPGTTESFPGCELRVERVGYSIHVAVFAHGEAVTRTLSCPVNHDNMYEEGFFTYMSPPEHLLTAWSDNDPARCQVITVEDLREFARIYAARQSTEAVLQAMAKAIHDALPESLHASFDRACAEQMPPEARDWYRALLAVGERLNRRITPNPASLCSVLFSLYENVFIQMEAVNEPDPDLLANRLTHIATAWLAKTYRSKEMAAPLAELFLYVRAWQP